MGRRPVVSPSRFRIGSEAAEVLQFRDNVARVFYQQAMALACNSIKITDLPAHVPQWYVKKVLFERGQIAFFGELPNEYNAYMCGGAGGIDIYGVPLRYVLVPMSGQTFEVDADSPMLSVFRANAVMFKLSDKIQFIAERIADCEVAISANLIHSQTTDFIEVEDEQAVTTIKTAMRQKLIGQPVVYARKSDAMAIGESVAKYNTAGDFYADRLALLRDQYKQELLAGVGTLSANKYKRERVQSSEVNAGVGEVCDYIYTTIDMFNEQAEAAGIAARMDINSTVADFYTDDAGEATV